MLDEPAGPTVLQRDGTVTRRGKVIDVDQIGLPTDDIIAIPVSGPGARPAYFAVSAAARVARPGGEQRQIAALLAHLAADYLASSKPPGGGSLKNHATSGDGRLP